MQGEENEKDAKKESASPEKANCMPNHLLMKSRRIVRYRPPASRDHKSWAAPTTLPTRSGPLIEITP